MSKEERLLNCRSIKLSRRSLFLFVVIAVCVQQCNRDEVLNSRVPIYDCEKCKYIVQEEDENVDGNALLLQPGDYICLSANKRRSLSIRFVNINGLPGNPIVITNCGGSIVQQVQPDEPYNIKFERSHDFVVKGMRSGDDYGFKLTGGTIGLSMDYLSTNFEIEDVEVCNASFAGIMAKTDPRCDSATIRGNFVLRNASFHDNFVHDVGGEGFYVGNSFYVSGVPLPCGIRFPHELENVKIFNNRVEKTGREAIQLGCTVRGAEIFNNLVRHFGLSNTFGQTNGIQVGEGTGGLCYNNKVSSGVGNGIIVLGLGDNYVYNNVISYTGGCGIFCDKRFTPGTGFSFINNTIVNPGGDGLRIFADSITLLNKVFNNLVVNPGTYWDYQLGDIPTRTGFDSYLFLKDTSVHVYQSNNFFTQDIMDAGFVNPLMSNFNLKRHSLAIDKGKDVSNIGITEDFCGRKRPMGKRFDMGAFEYDSLINSNYADPCRP